MNYIKIGHWYQTGLQNDQLLNSSDYNIWYRDTKVMVLARNPKQPTWVRVMREDTLTTEMLHSRYLVAYLGDYTPLVNVDALTAFQAALFRIQDAIIDNWEPENDDE